MSQRAGGRGRGRGRGSASASASKGVYEYRSDDDEYIPPMSFADRVRSKAQIVYKQKLESKSAIEDDFDKDQMEAAMQESMAMHQSQQEYSKFEREKEREHLLELGVDEPSPTFDEHRTDGGAKSKSSKACPLFDEFLSDDDDQSEKEKKSATRFYSSKSDKAKPPAGKATKAVKPKGTVENDDLRPVPRAKTAVAPKLTPGPTNQGGGLEQFVTRSVAKASGQDASAIKPKSFADAVSNKAKNVLEALLPSAPAQIFQQVDDPVMDDRNSEVEMGAEMEPEPKPNMRYNPFLGCLEPIPDRKPLPMKTSIQPPANQLRILTPHDFDTDENGRKITDPFEKARRYNAWWDEQNRKQHEEIRKRESMAPAVPIKTVTYREGEFMGSKSSAKLPVTGLCKLLDDLFPEGYGATDREFFQERRDFLKKQAAEKAEMENRKME